MSSFAPVCPFWVEIDMFYDLGKTIAMRSRSGDWRDPDQLPDASVPIPRPRPKRADEDGENAQTADPAHSTETEADLCGDDLPFASNLHMIQASNPFNTTRGASEALGGVFRYKDARIRVLPLLADPTVLGKFVENYIQVPGHVRVMPWGRYVYLLSSQYESITSDLVAGKKAHACELTFAVPVKCYDWEADDQISFQPEAPYQNDERWQLGAKQLVGTAMVTPFNYVDDITTAVTESEVFGVPTLRSEIVSPPEGWAADTAENGTLLQARAIVVPSLGTASEGTRQTLVEIRDTPMIDPDDQKSWRQVSSRWGGLLAKDMLAKRFEAGNQVPLAEWRSPHAFEWGRAMALRILGGLHGINTLSLKQFRDTTRPQNACYQGIVMRGTSIDRLHEVQEIERDLTVSITRYPTQPIAETLGLISKRTIEGDGGLCDEFEPIRPFEIRADLVTSRGKTLYERSTGTDWEMINLPDGPLGWRPASEDDVELARRNAQSDEHPSPKISYVRYDHSMARRERLKPLLLNDTEYKAWMDDVRSRNVHDTKLLWRGVELGSLVQREVLTAVDDGNVDDIHNFVRTRTPPESRNDEDDHLYADYVYQLAGALEFVSPATILDSVLSRAWGARHTRRSRYRMSTQDFRVRRQSLGPDLAEELFPIRESQEGYWPRSREFAFEHNLNDAMSENSLPHEFRKFLEVAVTHEEGIDNAVEIAKATLPSWFFESAFGGNAVVDQVFSSELSKEQLEELELPADQDTNKILKMAASLMGIWPGSYKRELKEGVIAFFDELIGDKRSNSELRHNERAWIRIMERLEAEAAPDGFTGSDTFDIRYLVEAGELKSEPRTPGWLQARLEMISANETFNATKLGARAKEWEKDFLQGRLG